MKRVYEPKVYKLAEELSDLVWHDFIRWNKKVLISNFKPFTVTIYSRGSLEETKSWLRKLIKRKVIDEADVSKYQIVIEKLGPKLNAFINSTKK